MSGSGSHHGSPRPTMFARKSNEKLRGRNSDADSGTPASRMSSSTSPPGENAPVAVTTAALLSSPVALRRVSSTPATIGTARVRIQRPIPSPRSSASQKRSVSSSSMQKLREQRQISPSNNSRMNHEESPLHTGYAFNRQTSMPPATGSSSDRTRPRSSSVASSRTNHEEIPLSKGYDFRRQMSMPARTSSVKDGSFYPLIVDGDASVGSWDEEESLGFDEAPIASPRRVFRPVEPLSSSKLQTDSKPAHRVSFVKEIPPLERVDTGQSSETDLMGVGIVEEDEVGSPRRRMAVLPEGDLEHSLSTPDKNDLVLRRGNVHYIVYLSTFAVFGVLIRVFMGRFFGLDCELKGEINDWFSTFSRHICVTASGLTEQTGGALFIDLPANMLGCFMMGVLSIQTFNRGRSFSPLPWLRENHPLQRHDAFHVAIQTGMCGCLTTFASWNAQMVVMMDGSQTQLGSQVLPALAGYVAGIMTALASFIFGTHASVWIDNHRNNASSTGAVEFETHDSSELPSNSSGKENPPPHTIIVYPKLSINRHSPLWKRLSWMCSCTRLPFLILGCLLAIFVVADFVWGVAFYRSLWLQAVFAPPGVLLRWFLASRWNHSSRPAGRMEWLPWGTLAANLLGSLVSVVMLDVEFWYLRQSGGSSEWALSIITAVRVGFAGSLSTVSTFVKELVDIQARYPNQGKAYHYGLLTIGSAMVMSLVVYIPIVRTTTG